jgi:hypothetical protein
LKAACVIRAEAGAAVDAGAGDVLAGVAPATSAALFAPCPLEEHPTPATDVIASASAATVADPLLTIRIVPPVARKSVSTESLTALPSR